MKGQSLIELGIIFPIVVLLLVGAVEFGMIFFQYVQLQDAAQEGALYGSAIPDDVSEIEKRVRYASQSPIDLSSPDVGVYISFENNLACEGSGLEVRVEYPHKIFMPILPQLLRTDVIMLRGRVVDTVLRPVCS